jgi:hypothetical protein
VSIGQSFQTAHQLHLPRNLKFLSRLFPAGQNRGNNMKIKTIALASLFALSSTLAFAQSSQGKAGSDNGPTSNAPTTQTPGTGTSGGMEMNKSGSMPSSKDASTQGANTAGSAEKKGDSASPGGTMKK